jgi:hypothetical protein
VTTASGTTAVESVTYPEFLPPASLRNATQEKCPKHSQYKTPASSSVARPRQTSIRLSQLVGLLIHVLKFLEFWYPNSAKWFTMLIELWARTAIY